MLTHFIPQYKFWGVWVFGFCIRLTIKIKEHDTSQNSQHYTLVLVRFTKIDKMGVQRRRVSIPKDWVIQLKNN